MKRPIRLASFVAFTLLPLALSAQCELFKSEIRDVQGYIEKVQSLTDTVRTYADQAAFSATYTEARENARKAQIYAGEILGAAYEAVTLAGEAQYHSVSCESEEAESYAIDAESFAIDVRDFADEAYTNAKKASSARNLGDIRYFMRKSLEATKEAQKAAESAVYAAADAHYSCNQQQLAAGGKE